MAHNPWNLKHMLAKRLLNEMILKVQSSHPGSGVVLVVDPHTSAILSSCLRLSDLLSHGVLVLQKLELARERLDLPAVYFIEPTPEAFELLIEDFPAPPPPPPPPPAPTGAVQAALQSLTKTPRSSGPGSGAGSVGAAASAAAAAASRAPQCQYSSAHLFFTGPVPAALMKRLQSAQMDRRRLRSFVELGVDFCAFESRVFLLDDPRALPRLYPLPPDDDPDGPFPAPANSVLRPAVAQLVSLCATVLAPGERPYVRHVSEDLGVGTALSKQFADLFDRAMDRRLAAAAAAGATAASSTGAVATAASPSPAPAPRNSTVLIVDRSLDPLTPLMHEFTFQAMLNDLLRVRGEIAHLRPPGSAAAAGASATPHGAAATAATATAASGTSAPASTPPAAAGATSGAEEADLGELVLSEDDPLWIEYRHKHIGEVMVSVNRRLKEFASSNKMAQYQHLQTQLAANKEKAKKAGKDKSAAADGDSSQDTVKDVLRAVAEMPEYKRRMRQYSKHLALAEACLAKFQQRHLSDVAELEQSLATNADADGAVYSSARGLKEALKDVVLDRAFPEPPLVGVLDKLRLAAVYAVVQGGLPEPLAKVLAAGLHPKLLRSVLGPSARLAAMGVDLESLEPQLSRERVAELIERNQSQPLALMRFVPTLRGILEALVAGQLTEEQFPYTARGGAPPSPPPTPAHSAASTPSSSSVRRLNKAAAAAAAAHQSALQAGLSEGERQRQKLLADAEADVAHRATGRSARRRHSVRDPPPSSSTATSAADTVDEGAAAAAAASSTSAPPAHRFIVFMLGGLSFSEMRCAYEVAEGGGGGGPSVPLLIGSTAALTPAEYLLDLSGLTRKDFHALVLASSAAATAALATPMATSVAAAEEAAKAKAKAAAAAAAAAQRNGKGKQSNGRRSDMDSDDDEVNGDSGSDSDSDNDDEAGGPGGRRRSAHGQSGSGRSGGSGNYSDSDSLSDISDPDTSDDDDDQQQQQPQRTHPSTRRQGGGGGGEAHSGAGSGAGNGIGGGSAAGGRNGSAATAAAPNANARAKSKSKKIVLIFASESDGDDGDQPPPTATAPRPRTDKSKSAPTGAPVAVQSAAQSAAQAQSARSAKAAGSVRPTAPSPAAPSPRSARSDVPKAEGGQSHSQSLSQSHNRSQNQSHSPSPSPNARGGGLPLAQRLLRRLRGE